MQNNKQKNRLSLKKMLIAKPGLTHVYMKRLDMDNSVIDIPIKDVEQTMTINPFWEIVESIAQIDDDLKELFIDDDTSAPSLDDNSKKESTLQVPDVPTIDEMEEADKVLNPLPTGSAKKRKPLTKETKEKISLAAKKKRDAKK